MQVEGQQLYSFMQVSYIGQLYADPRDILLFFVCVRQHREGRGGVEMWQCGVVEGKR